MRGIITVSLVFSLQKSRYYSTRSIQAFLCSITSLWLNFRKVDEVIVVQCRLYNCKMPFYQFNSFTGRLRPIVNRLQPLYPIVSENTLRT